MLDAAVLDAVARAAAARSLAGVRTTPEPAATALRDARAALRQARAVVRAQKQHLRADPLILARYAAINAWAAEEQRRLRAACGCYWGTYLLIEASAEQARRAPTPPVPRHRQAAVVLLRIEH